MSLQQFGNVLNPILNPNGGLQQDGGGAFEIQGRKLPYVLFQSGIPVILISSGTFADTTGSMTGLTALPYTPSGVVQVFVFSGAGIPVSTLYYARFSSTTACQLYLDSNGTVKPTGITAGAYAGGTANVALFNVPIPANSLGNNGSLRYSFSCGYANSVSNKVIQASINSTVIGSTGAVTTSAATRGQGLLTSGGVQTAQLSGAPFSASSLTYINTTSALLAPVAIDMTANATFALSAQLSSAADFVMLGSLLIEILPSN